MVKTLIPDAFAGPRTVDAVWQNRVNVGALDRGGQSTRLRLNATVVRVEHAGEPSSAPHVVVTYVKGNRLYNVRARSVVVAGGSWTAKHIVNDLPTSHREAYAQFYRSPCLMATSPSATGASSTRWDCPAAAGSGTRRLSLGTEDGARRNEPRTIGPDSPTVLTIKVLFASPASRSPSRGVGDARSCSAPRSRGTSARSASSSPTCSRPADSIRAGTSPASS